MEIPGFRRIVVTGREKGGSRGAETEAHPAPSSALNDAGAAPVQSAQSKTFPSDKVAGVVPERESPDLSARFARFSHNLKALTEILGNLGKWVVAVGTLTLFLVVCYRVFHDRSIQIGAIAVPQDLENRGYTSRAVAERLYDEIDQIGRTTVTRFKSTEFKKERFALADQAEPPDIEVPKTGLSFRSIVLFLQDAFDVQPPLVTGEITEDERGSLSATVSITHSSGRIDSSPTFKTHYQRA
jgi:hypothetical protein